MDSFDAIVVGAGPNGLAVAVTLARAGLSVRVYEAAATIGGGSRTMELVEPGHLNDVCSAVHPLAFESEFFRRFRLEDRVELLTPELSYAQPLDGGRAGLAWRDLDRTVEGLGRDGAAWRQLFAPLVDDLRGVADFTSGSLVRIPQSPTTALRLGLRALEQGSAVWNARFREGVAPALLTGAMAHSIQAMPSLATSAGGLVLATLAHGRGWPVVRGGSQAIVDAMAADAEAHGAEIVTSSPVSSVAELPPAKAVFFDTSARAMASIAGDRLPERYRRALEDVRYGNAAAKVDFVLDGPVPWRDPALAEAGTLHVGGSRAELQRAENEVRRGRHAPSPYVLVSQPSVLDPTRAPAGRHVLWAYTHVPHGSTVDQTETITAQIERFAPGFRDRIVGSASKTAAQMEEYNANYVGGDIAIGDVTFLRLLRRPVLSPDPWRAPGGTFYLCSSATPPSPGVHGLNGWRAATSALRHEFGIRRAPELAPEGVLS